MGWSRRRMLAVVGGASTLPGCGRGEVGGSATPPPAAFEVTAIGDHAVELRYTGIGSQDPARFRVVLSGAREADGTYGLANLTKDTAWTEEDRYVLNQTSLGLAAPLSIETLTVELQYNDDGDWRTIARTRPAD